MTEKRKTTNTKGISLDKFHKLSIQVSLNGLSFCVLDTINNTILNSDNLVFDNSLNPLEIETRLKALLQKHGLVRSSFTEVIVIHANGLFSFVPNSLFDKNELANYLKFNSKILANDHISFDVLENYDMTNVYVPFMNINNYIFELFGEFEYKHNGTVMVEALLSKTPTNKKPVCYVHIDHRQMEIIVVEDKKLLFYNSFNYFTKEDFLYYLLFTFEQLKLSTETTKLKLFGTIEEGDDLYMLTYKYIQEIAIFVPAITEFPMANTDEKSIDFTILSSL